MPLHSHMLMIHRGVDTIDALSDPSDLYLHTATVDSTAEHSTFWCIPGNGECRRYPKVHVDLSFVTICTPLPSRSISHTTKRQDIFLFETSRFANGFLQQFRLVRRISSQKQFQSCADLQCEIPRSDRDPPSCFPFTDDPTALFNKVCTSHGRNKGGIDCIQPHLSCSKSSDSLNWH